MSQLRRLVITFEHWILGRLSANIKANLRNSKRFHSAEAETQTSVYFPETERRQWTYLRYNVTVLWPYTLSYDIMLQCYGRTRTLTIWCYSVMVVHVLVLWPHTYSYDMTLQCYGRTCSLEIWLLRCYDQTCSLSHCCSPSPPPPPHVLHLLMCSLLRLCTLYPPGSGRVETGRPIGWHSTVPAARSPPGRGTHPTDHRGTQYLVLEGKTSLYLK